MDAGTADGAVGWRGGAPTSQWGANERRSAGDGNEAVATSGWRGNATFRAATGRQRADVDYFNDAEEGGNDAGMAFNVDDAVNYNDAVLSSGAAEENAADGNDADEDETLPRAGSEAHIEARENLLLAIREWNTNRLDLFEISEPCEVS